MPIKKKAPMGPKAKLMKKSVDQLKRQAKKLKIAGYSTKKKLQLVNSIMMAEARAKRKPGTKRKTAKKKTAMSARGAAPNRMMRKPVRSGVKKPVRISPMRGRMMKKPMMAQGYAKFEGFGLRELNLAGELLIAYSDKNMTDIARDYFAGYSNNIEVGFNPNSGYVFLVDEDYNTLMFNGSELDMFISTPYEGVEGFIDELFAQYEDLHPEDQEYLDTFKEYKYGGYRS